MKDSTSKIASIILAGGLSSRMMDFKPLMLLGKKTFVEHLISLYQSVGIRNIYVVTGHRASEINAKIKKYNVKNIYNPEYKRGMFFSILSGIHHLCTPIKYFFIHPVDVPLVRPYTITTLISAANIKTNLTILYPFFDGKKGHPPLISIALKNNIKKWNKPGGLRECLKSIKKSANIPVADQGITINVNTPENYNNLLDKFYKRNILTPEECIFLMEQITQTPDKIIKHCKIVSKIATSLATAVNKTNKLSLNVELVKSSALIHDIFRNKKKHAEAGGRLLKQLGFKEMGSIVKQHMNIFVYEKLPITESEIVYLADKLVNDNILINLKTKLETKKKMYKRDSEIRTIITHKINNALKIKHKIELITSMPAEKIIEKTKF